MLIYCLILLLLSCAINLKKDKAILYSRLFLLSLFNCFIIGYNLLYINFINEGIGIFGGLFSVTALNSIFNLFIFFFFFNKEKILNTMNEQYRITEYSLILLFIIIGGIFLMGSSDTISIFLSIEL